MSDPAVTFEVSSFEQIPSSASYQLIVSATAFHRVDPGIAWTKAARLLQPSGWLALLTTGERYDEPLRSSLRALWGKYNPHQPWISRAPWADTLGETNLFGAVVEVADEQRIALSADTVVGVECTRATFLSFSDAGQKGFRTELEQLLRAVPVVELTQETLLAMAPVVAAGAA